MAHNWEVLKLDITEITVDDFKNHFVRDFPYAPINVSIQDSNALKYVFDEDIEKAFKEAQISFNQNLFSTDDAIEIGYLYLSAHYLVTDLRRSISGLNSTPEYLVASRGVGSVSEAYSLPQEFLTNPAYSFFMSSGYGQKYIALILPALVGNVCVIEGKSQA